MTPRDRPLQDQGGAVRDGTGPSDARSIIIRPSRGWVPLNFIELWDHRELFWFLVWRDLKVRYRQTLLGALWVVVQPVFATIVFTIFFGKLAAMPSDGVPYPLFSFAAMVPWTFFAQALTGASNSVISNQGLIRKTYFPRLVIPMASVLSSVVDFALALVVLFGMMCFYGVFPTARVIWFPLLLLLAIATALGAGLWLAASNVYYRDVKYILPFLVQAWLFLTPVVYPSSLLMQPWRTVYALNPMVGVVEGFRWVLLDTNTTPGPLIAASAIAALLLLGGGAYYFRRMERSFADVI